MKTKANKNIKSYDYYLKHCCLSDEWGFKDKNSIKHHWYKKVIYKNCIAINYLWYSNSYFDSISNNYKTYALVIHYVDGSRLHAGHSHRFTKKQLKNMIVSRLPKYVGNS